MVALGLPEIMEGFHHWNASNKQWKSSRVLEGFQFSPIKEMNYSVFWKFSGVLG